MANNDIFTLSVDRGEPIRANRHVSITHGETEIVIELDSAEECFTVRKIQYGSGPGELSVIPCVSNMIKLK